ncbi:MAG: polyprenyl synthetase family protein [Lentisphaeria bacterium]
MESLKNNLEILDTLSTLPYPEAVKKYTPILTEYIIQKLAQNNRILPENLQLVTASYLNKPGKYLRPRLVMLTCEAAGKAPSKALPAAAAMEMFHNWTLIHDDIIDHDTIRRNHPTGHVFGAELGKKAWSLADKSSKEYGLSLAILSGDVLQGQVFQLLSSLHDLDARVILSLINRLSGKLYNELLAGEQLDIDLSNRHISEIEVAEIMEMMRLKTGSLLQFCAEIGYAIGQNMPVEENYTAQQLGLFAESCGIAFQLQDDILGIYGDPQKLGKNVGSDLREGKHTVLLRATWQNASKSEQQLIEKNVGNPNASQEDLCKIKQMMLDKKIVDKIKAIAEGKITFAMQTLHASIPDAPIRQHLELWAESMTQRHQ